MSLGANLLSIFVPSYFLTVTIRKISTQITTMSFSLAYITMTISVYILVFKKWTFTAINFFTYFFFHFSKPPFFFAALNNSLAV